MTATMEHARLLLASGAGQPVSLAGHEARHGRLPPCQGDKARAASLAEVAAAGLTGRGGAAFPTARKLAAVADAKGSPLVIANGTEGEPASAKDKVLLATQPHLVLDGAVHAARITGAREVVVVAHQAVAAMVSAAVADRQVAGWDGLRLHVLPAADRFVAGEATAVANWVHRRAAVPLTVPPRLCVRGPGGQPTLVQNVETLAHLALIARYGAGWFRALGTPAEPGSMLVTVIGAVRDPGVLEVPIGIPLADVLRLAGGPSAAVGALLLGGYSGTWAAASTLALPFSAAGLAASNAVPGAGLIAVLPEDVCGLAETARVALYLAAQSAGQCGPCVFGLEAIAGELAALAADRGCDRAALHRWLGQVDGRGGCGHPSGAVRFVRSALRVFAGEISSHAIGWCCGTSGGWVLPVPESARPARR